MRRDAKPKKNQILESKTIERDTKLRTLEKLRRVKMQWMNKGKEKIRQKE